MRAMTLKLHRRKIALSLLDLYLRFPMDPCHRVFARLNEVEKRMGRQLPQFLNTHPASAVRVEVRRVDSVYTFRS